MESSKRETIFEMVCKQIGDQNDEITKNAI